MVKMGYEDNTLSEENSYASGP